MHGIACQSKAAWLTASQAAIMSDYRRQSVATRPDKPAERAGIAARAAVIIAICGVEVITHSALADGAAITTRAIHGATTKITHLMIVVVVILSLSWLAANQQGRSKQSRSDQSAHCF